MSDTEQQLAPETCEVCTDPNSVSCFCDCHDVMHCFECIQKAHAATAARVSGEVGHLFEGTSKSVPCAKCGLIYSASVHSGEVGTGEAVANMAAEIARLTKWQDLCFELLSEVRQWIAPGSIRDTDAPRVLRALLSERAELKQLAAVAGPTEEARCVHCDPTFKPEFDRENLPDWCYCRCHATAGPTPATPDTEELRSRLEAVLVRHNRSRTHTPKYCCPEDEHVYDRLLIRSLVEEITRIPDAPCIRLYDDSEPVLSGLSRLAEDQQATDGQRRLAAAALAEIERLRSAPSSVREAAHEIADRWFRDDLPEAARVQSLKMLQLQWLAETVISKYVSVGPEQTWCDHCSADLNGVKHILCERCYREYAGPKWTDPEFNTTPSAESAPFNPPTHRCNGVNDAQRHGTQNKCSVCGEYRNGWFDSNGMEVLTPKESVQSAGAALITEHLGECVKSYLPLATAIDAAIVSAVKQERERCVIKALEQRCERGTPWDAAILAVVKAIRQGTTEP